MRRGFTLVELSIVLVIIGLLIGGILVAQSMISTAKIAAQISQIQQFDAGVMSFKAAYKHLPGDAPGLGGNGDGWIISCCGGSTTRFMGEIGRFWNNLNSREFANCSGQCQAISVGPTKNVPMSKIGTPKAFLIASAISSNGWSADMTLTENYYAILDASQVQAQVSGEWQFTATSSTNPAYKPSAATPSDLSALDMKSDDGIANAGSVISGRVGGGAAGAIIKTPLATCSAGAVYLMSNSTAECTPLIRIGAQAGEIQ